MNSTHNSNDIEAEIEIINRMIEEAIFHGGDLGGPYYSNEDNLRQFIQEWLKFKNINNFYHVLTKGSGILYIAKI